MFAKPIPGDKCPGCGGGAFALCNGTIFNECECDLPSEFSLDAGTFEASIVYLTEGGVTTFDAGATTYPCCSGNTYLEIPANECPSNCKEKVGYVLCYENSFSQCACSVPEGYTLSTITCDGG
jgi:hypothetical protein